MYLVILIENFRLFAALRLKRLGGLPPAALVDAGGVVLEVNGPALGRGVCAGMTAPKAMARCNALAVLNPDPAAERAARRLLWNCAWQITPQIELTAAGRVTLQLVRPEQAALIGQVERQLGVLRGCGLPARAGAAPTPEWAYLAAVSAEPQRFKLLPGEARAKELLEHLDLERAECLDPELIPILRDWGLRSLGDLARLPRAALGDRLGERGLAVWDQLNGRRQRLLRFSRIEPSYSQRFEPEDPVETLEALGFLVRRGVEALEVQLAQAGKLARAVGIRLEMREQAAHDKRIRLPEATNRASLLERLLCHHLEQVRLRGPVTGLELSVDPVDPLGRQAGLFERSVRNPWRLQETLDQLAGLVGLENFGTPRALESHRPDAFRLAPLPAEVAAEPAPALSGPPLMGPPLRRYRPARPVGVRLREGRPVYLTADGWEGAVTEAGGPYPMGGDWWTAERWSRVEWDVAVGGRGLFRLARMGGRWWLAGSYD